MPPGTSVPLHPSSDVPSGSSVSPLKTYTLIPPPIIMVLPFLPAIAGHALRFGLTSSSARSALGTFAQSLPFGAGYSFGTYIGFPKNYQSRSARTLKTNTITINNNKMPYRRYSRYSRYSRYPTRRRYSRYMPRRVYRRYY